MRLETCINCGLTPAGGCCDCNEPLCEECLSLYDGRCSDCDGVRHGALGPPQIQQRSTPVCTTCPMASQEVRAALAHLFASLAAKGEACARTDEGDKVIRAVMGGVPLEQDWPGTPQRAATGLHIAASRQLRTSLERNDT